MEHATILTRQFISGGGHGRDRIAARVRPRRDPPRARPGPPLGLLHARREDGWGGYASFSRRAARLGHVALVMLPVLAGGYAQWLSGVSAPALAPAAWAWVLGGPALAGALFLAAWKPALRAALVAPALALTASAVVFAVSGLA